MRVPEDYRQRQPGEPTGEQARRDLLRMPGNPYRSITMPARMRGPVRAVIGAEIDRLQAAAAELSARNARHRERRRRIEQEIADYQQILDQLLE